MKYATLRFKKNPYKHQRDEFFKYRTHKARARFWTMRTGKTKVTIDEGAFLYNIEEITGIIVIAPNTVHENWLLKEFPEHCPIPYEGMIYKSVKAGQKGVQAKFQHLCMNRDTLKVFSINSTALRTKTAKSYLLTFLKHHKGRVMVVFDEAHDFKKPGSQRTVTARGVAKLALYKRLLTGTPIHGSPMNAYSEFELLEQGALGCKTYEEFKNEFGLWEVTKTRAGRPYIKFLGPKNEEELTRRMERFTSIVRREDVPELWRPLNIERMFEMTDIQRKIYTSLEENPVLDNEVLDGGVFFQKLQQIGSGFLITKSEGLKEIVRPEENPRFDLIMAEIKKAQGKVVLWGMYHYEFQAIAKLLEAEDIGYCEVHGLAKTKSHIQTIYEFGRSNYQKVLVGHPVSGGVGGDISFANTLIWGSHTFNLIDREQASERGTAIGKLPVDLIDIIARNSVDQYILNALTRKINIADAIASTGLVDLKRFLAESYV